MYSWEEVKRAVEHKEDARLLRSLAEVEVKEGFLEPDFFLMQLTRPYLEVLGSLVVGLYAALMSIGFNYLLFNWILHVNFGR
jgi:hypothetical protein